jgi:hypothetical protein
MKPLLLLLLTAMPLCAATTYPVLTDVPQRTFTGGGTNVALLSGTNTYTGTNTFAPASFFPANNIGLRLLWSSPTNVYLPTLSTFANPTNNGDYDNITAIGKVTLPALIGTNSWVFITMMVERTNANVTVGTMYCYLGTNTNFLGSLSIVATSTGKSGSGFVQATFANEGSYTNQRQHGTFSTPIIWGTSNFVDTSVAWDMYLGMATVTSCTNAFFPRLAIYELPQ